MGRTVPARPPRAPEAPGQSATVEAALPSPNGKPRRRQDDGWLDRWALTVSALTRLTNTHPMMDAIIEEQRGRRIQIGDRWLADFASCNYLGFDLDPEIIATVPEYLARWGTHPSWSRLLGSPRMYEEIEEQMTGLLGCEDVLLLPTITHIHTSVIPVLVGDGTIFLDGRAHKTIYDGAMYAAGSGAAVVRFRHNDSEHLREMLSASDPSLPRLIAMDGVNSMTGNAPDLDDFARVAREHDALLYVDDAHGFGVIGERAPDEPCDYGTRGNGIVRHQGERYDDVVLVAGMSKAYSSLLAFIACPPELKRVLKTAAPPHLYSGPPPRWSPGVRSGSVSRSPRRTPTSRSITSRRCWPSWSNGSTSRRPRAATRTGRWRERTNGSPGEPFHPWLGPPGPAGREGLPP